MVEIEIALMKSLGYILFLIGIFLPSIVMGFGAINDLISFKKDEERKGTI
jgi:hypothetical protein